jgi:uncharacterized protein (UPF0210 family)
MLVLITGAMIAARPVESQTASAKVAKVRTITVGIPLENTTFDRPVSSALAFLQEAKKAVTAAGYEVQTVRLTTTPCGHYLRNMAPSEAAAWARSLDKTLASGQASAGLGPANGMSVEAVTALLAQTENLSATISVTTASNQLDEGGIHAAALIMQALSVQTKQGLGNFRFAAIANCPPGIPFFPAGYHEGTASDFAVGMEGAAWVLKAFSGTKDVKTARAELQQLIVKDLLPMVKTMTSLEKSSARTFSGFDVSTAPQAAVSIGRAVEELNGYRFGGPGTLAVCAVITDVLKGLPLKTCGFSGLMLPVMEDSTLALRVAEGRVNLDQLLLYSSVCGTGIDVVPIPGDTPVSTIEAIIRDVAALSIKWRKPLTVRLLPVPGKKAGEMTLFSHPSMVNTRVMQLPAR